MLRALFAVARPIKYSLKYNYKVNVSPLMKPIYFKFSTNKPNDQKDEKKQEKQKQIVEKADEEKQVVKEEQVKQEIKEEQANLSVGKKAWNFVVDSWKHTFPDEEYEFKRLQEKRKNSIKETALKKKIQQEKKQKEMEETAAQAVQSHALVGLKNEKLQQQKKQVKGKQRKSGFIGADEGKGGRVGKVIDSIKNAGYVTGNVVENIKAGQGMIGKGVQSVSSYIEDKSSIAKVTTEMRKIYEGFQPTQVQIEAKVLFLKTYNEFLKGNHEFVEQNCIGKALSYFNMVKQMNKTRNVRPYSPQLSNPGDIYLIDAKLYGQIQGQTEVPYFVFQISAQQTACFVDLKDGKIVEGNPSLVQQSNYMFVIQYSEQAQNQTGQPWLLFEIVKLQSTPLLV